MIDYIKSHRAGHVLCGLGLFFGPLMLVLSYYMIASQGAYNSMGMGFGIFFSIIGVMFLVFPGGSRRIADYPNQEVNIRMMLEEAPKLHRIVWYIGFGLGILLIATIDQWLPYVMEWLGM